MEQFNNTNLLFWDDFFAPMNLELKNGSDGPIAHNLNHLQLFINITDMLVIFLNYG